MNRWRSAAQAAIEGAIRRCRAADVTDPKTILQHVDNAYPFGERAMHPYKIWLDERKKARVRLGLLPAGIPNARPEYAQPMPAPDEPPLPAGMTQTSIFDGPGMA